MPWNRVVHPISWNTWSIQYHATRGPSNIMEHVVRPINGNEACEFIAIELLVPLSAMEPCDPCDIIEP